MRARLAVLFLIAALGACGGAVPNPAVPPTSACDPAHLAECEKRLGAERDLIRPYLAARAARDPDDPWVRIDRALAEAPAPDAVILVESGTTADAGPARTITSARLPEPAAITTDDLLLAVAEAAGIKHLVHLRGGAAATHLFPDDPLAPFLPGLRPVVRGDAARLAADLALARAVRLALAAAGDLRFVDAAREAERIQRAIAARDDDEPVRRARYALHLLANAGLVLEPIAGQPSPASPPTSRETPYGAYLAVAAAREPEHAWPERAASILAGVAPERRDDVAAIFVRPSACDARRAPHIDAARDLVFAGRLAASLTRDPAPRPGELSFSAWIPRYENAVRLVERTRTAWSYLPSLLAQRGEASGFGAGSTVHRRVTEMGLAHLAAMEALERAEPARHRSVALLGLAVTPGLLADPDLRKAMATRLEASVKSKLAAAEDPDAVLSAVLTGAVAGLSYPPSLQEAHLGALQAAITEKLRGDLLRRVGWGVAALYAGDAIYRLLAGVPGDPDFTARQIARALADRDLPQPALAALSAAAARYAALAAGKKLDPETRRADRLPAERRAARADLRAALASLGASGEAPPRLLDDLTELTDGLAAAVAAGVTGARRHKATARVSCGAQPTIALDQGTRRTIARLGDVRLRLLEHPAMVRGEGAWVKRARVLTAILSDAMDLAVASDTGKPPVFVVRAADVERAWRAAASGPAADALAGAHALARAFAASRDTGAFVHAGGKEIRRVAGALLAIFGEPGARLGLLDLLAQPTLAGDDLTATLIAGAASLHQRKQQDQADLSLLAVLVVGSLTRAPPPDEAVSIAEKQGSRVAWALRFMKEIRKSSAPDPAAYAENLRRATDDACQAPDAEATIAVMEAIHAHAAGKRDEARAALDRVIAQAEERGLGVPRMIFRHEEKTPARVFSADVEVSFGAGVLLTGNSFQLGLGVRSGGEPEGALTAALAPAGSARAGEDVARYYVYTAALATAYHLLAGDTERAVAAGRRVVSALSNGLVLGPRRLRSERPSASGEDAREVLIVAAQLAAEAGLPFLAGDLWTVVRQGFADALDDRAVSAMLDRLPLGLAGVADLAPVVRRARRSLAVIAEPLACTQAKVELGAFDEAGCDGYPLALSLRIGGALRKLPRLKRGPDTTARCAPLKSLDTFLAAAETGTYDPDAFTRAVEELGAAGKTDDAAALMARHKRAGHCSPAIVAAARALGRRAALGPAVRADLLSSALNCTATTASPEVADDLLALDDETRRLPDASRGLTLALSIAELAAHAGRWDLLGKLVDRPDFVARWLAVHPGAAAAALVLDHAAAVMRGQPVALERTAATHHLVCEAFPAPERSAACADVAALRAPATPAERRRLAGDAIKRLLAAASAKKP